MSETHEEPTADLEPQTAEVPALPEEPQPVPETPRPGRALREAREARRLAVFEVAQSLKFSPRQIEALETDDYAQLPPGATFLRGFVRSYAKFLKIDAEPLLAMLDARAPVALPDIRAPQNMGVAATPVASGRRASTPMLIGAAMLAVAAAGLGAWHFLGQPTRRAAETTTLPAPATEPAPAADTAVRPPDIRVEETPPPAAAPTAPETADPGALKQRQLVFSFSDKSWVEVKDASQRVILAGEYPAGARQAVAGKPPFQVVIGNAPKVELQYEDRQVDLTPHTRAEVARLTLE